MFDLKQYTIIFTIINFIILMLILKHFLFDRVNNMISLRQNEIDTSIKKAKEDELVASESRKQSEGFIKGSRIEGKAIVEEQRAKALKLSEEIIKDSRNEAQTILQRAMKETKREKEKAESELKSEVVNLAVLLSSKALEGAIDEKEHRRLINDFIAKAGLLGGYDN